jgi:iron complex outermembrane receptor protein
MAETSPHLKHLFEVTTAVGIGLIVAVSPQARAADPVDLGTVQATGGGMIGTGAVDSAPYQAPTKAPLDATQPTSVISQQYIEHNVPLSGNYDNAVKIAPSVSAVSPNGPGLQENSILSIRGFQDGQYNVTFDGIPWGDSNDFTHHSTSYFMAHDLGAISVDRGPGTAATIGYATFGGSIAIQSKDPSATTTVTPYTMHGSFNTHLYGAQYDTGSLVKYGGTTAFIDGESLTSDGYLTNSRQSRQNGFMKIEQPIGSNTVLTGVAMYNNLEQNVSLGATKAQIAKFGPNFALSSDPSSQNFFGYNHDQIHNDFEYLGIKSNLGNGWTLDNKIYTYAYYHLGLNGEDPNGETPNGTVVNGVAQPNGVPGQKLQNDYRSIGDMTRLQKEVGFGDIQAGVWYDHQINTRSLFEVDMTQSLALNTGFGNPVDRELHQSLDTVQPYLQIDWKPDWIPGLTLSPGVKYSRFTRSLDAQVNIGTGQPLQTSVPYDAILPSMLLHYAINPNWSTYAQAAKGFLAANQNILNTTDPTLSHVSPQQSWNYQIGTAWQTKRLAADVDAYYIDFSNQISSRTVGGIAEFFNLGGTTYKGLEAEATYYVDYGFSLYGNGSINRAEDKTNHQPVPNAPEATAAAGVIYNQAGWYGSLIEKWVGTRYGDVNKQQGLDPYGTLDASLSYTLTNGPSWAPPATLKIEANNLLDSTKIYAFAGTTAAQGTPLYWTIPGRSFFVTLSAPL